MEMAICTPDLCLQQYSKTPVSSENQVLHLAASHSIPPDDLELIVLHDPHLLAAWYVLLQGAQQLSTLLSLGLGHGHIGQAEHRLHQATHSHGSVDGDRVGLTEQPAHEGLDAGIELRVSAGHQAAHDPGQQVGGDGDDAHRACIVPCVVCLVVVATPALRAAAEVRRDARIASALLHPQEVGVPRDAAHHLVADILAGTAGHVVDNGGALVQCGAQVRDQARGRGLAVVRVDLQRCVHAHREALLRGMQRLACAVAASVAHNS
eukprot:1142173-Pelagomonas_calceolata.AAC.1